MKNKNITKTNSMLGHGNGYVCGAARNRNQLTRLPASIASLDVLAINKVSVRSLDDITYYRYHVVLGDADHKSYIVDATFIVMLCKKSGKYSIVSVEYNIRDLVDNKECGQSDYKSDTDCSDESSDSSDSDCEQSNNKKSNTKSRKSNGDDSDCSDNKRRSNSKNNDCSDDEFDKCRTNSKSDCSDDQSDKRRTSSKSDCSDNSSDEHSDKQITRQNNNSNKSNTNTKRRSL